jgi:hypothetical protein
MMTALHDLLAGPPFLLLALAPLAIAAIAGGMDKDVARQARELGGRVAVVKIDLLVRPHALAAQRARRPGH